MCGYFTLAITSSITHPLKLSLFHISYWSIGVLNGEIYRLYISDLKPICEESDVYNTADVDLLSRKDGECFFSNFSGDVEAWK